MRTGEAIAKIMKREGVEMLIAYPVNHMIEFAAQEDIRTIIVRQERVGLHMADAISRLSSGEKIGAFAMQHGPGTENAFGGVAQCYGESSPVLVLPMGYARAQRHVKPNFNSVLNYQNVTKSAEPILRSQDVPNIMRRAFTQLRNGRPGPCMVEIPADSWGDEVAEELAYTPVMASKFGPDPADVEAAADALVAAERPVIHAGQGIHYAKAWAQLERIAELLAAPVLTTLGGKSSFNETHPLSLGAAGVSHARHLSEFLNDADLVFGAGCSFTSTGFGPRVPAGKTIVHQTLDPLDINKDVIATHALVGDAGLALDALIEAVEDRLGGEARDMGPVTSRIAEIKAEWLEEWTPMLTSDETPLSPYRVLHELDSIVDKENCIITHDAGSPRDQIVPFWTSTAPLSYIGWGKTTQLGYGLGLAMGAKLAHPEKLCMNVWGDAAIGFTGMDFETAVRERIPILSILMNNFSMAIELNVMPISTEKYRSTDISGNYADMAKAFGGYGERVTEPGEIANAIRRGIEATEAGQPALLEFITGKETRISRYPPRS